MFNRIIKEVPQECIKIAIHSKNTMHIDFLDGTYIQFIPANDKSKGYRFDRIFYQEGIDNVIINNLIRPMWTPVRPMCLE